jgi:metal-responsive CopG/Arc/MetJ family transcriptional regulator
MTREKNQAARRRLARAARERVSVTLPPELVVRLDAEAERERRSRAQIVEFAVLEYLDRRQGA